MGPTYSPMNHRHFDPNSPMFAAWLKSLEPEAELAMRHAMGALFPELGEDKEFTSRSSELTHQLKPDAKTFARVANRAVELEAIACAPWSSGRDDIMSLGAIPDTERRAIPDTERRKSHKRKALVSERPERTPSR